MIRILTTTKEEYKYIKELLKNNYRVDILEPEHCYAFTSWSIEDIREYMPPGTTDENLELALGHIEKTLKEDMIDRGWDSIETLKGEMRNAIEGGCKNV